METATPMGPFDAEVFAPAKINLNLRVLGKRADGFHEIDTLMVPVGIGDTIRIAPGAPGIACTCSDPAVPADDRNLAVRAARSFFDAIGETPAISVHLEKRVPVGAGLGGGSSDAAAVLAALNECAGLPFGPKQLAGLASGLGSDVPFFLARSAAVCRGRGEIVTPVEFPHRLRVVLLKPPFPVPTPWAYRRLAEHRATGGGAAEVREMPFGVLTNDFEPPVFGKYVHLACLKRWLAGRAGVMAALMSGSGATVFGVLDSGADATELLGRAAERFGKSHWAVETEVSIPAPGLPEGHAPERFGRHG